MVSCCLSQIFPALTHMPCMLSALCCSFVESSLEVLVSSTMGKGGVEMSCLHSSESAGSVLMAEWAGSSWGHSLMSICRQHINRQWNSGRLRSAQDLAWGEQRAVPSTWQRWAALFLGCSPKLQGSLNLNIPGFKHGTGLPSLLGTESGLGGKTAILLCWRTGCAHLPNDGAHQLRHAVKIC